MRRLIAWSCVPRPRTSPLPLLMMLMRHHGGHSTGNRSAPMKITWQLASGEARTVVAYEGQTLLEAAQEHDIPVEGACGGSCACSTCHVVVSSSVYSKLPEASDAEEDMLDLAPGLTPTSRLGCQVRLVRNEHDGMIVQLPKFTRNMAVDGYVSKPH